MATGGGQKLRTASARRAPPWKERASGARLALGTTKEVLGSIVVLAFRLDFLGFPIILLGFPRISIRLLSGF